jgi:hypothetical protein
MFVGHDWWKHQSMQAALIQGEGTQQIEGSVQDHWIKEQTRETGNEIRIEAIENFRIAHVNFRFTQTKRRTTYFTNAADNSVGLRDGMRLRVVYVVVGEVNKIVKLEVAQ